MPSNPDKNVNKSNTGAVRDYSNEPFFIKKNEEARKTMEKVIKNGGLPKELLYRMKSK